MSCGLTVAAVNAQASEFWANEKLALDRSLPRASLVTLATGYLTHDQFGEMPLGRRRSFEKALQDAERAEELLWPDEERAKDELGARD